MKNKAILIVAIFISVAGILPGGAYFWLQSEIHSPGPYSTNKTLVIEKGMGVREIAQVLEKENIVSKYWLVLIHARLTDSHRGLKAGEYEFKPGMNIPEILAHLSSHNTVTRSLTIPEGLTSWEIVELLYNEPALSGDIDRFPDQGSLLPETFHYSLNDKRESVIQRMETAMTAAEEKLFNLSVVEKLPLSRWEDVVTLASIVEKETGKAEERAKVASVFINRLRKGMKLQSDPTVIYALTKGVRPLGRALTRKDWKVKDPYNTYYVNGLPPGPISNPGIDSIMAVLNPADTDYLYFVADGTGGHAFAKTLKEHNRNVAAWRKIKAQQQ